MVSFDRLVFNAGKTLEQYLEADIKSSPSFQASMDYECQKQRYEDLVSGFESRETAMSYLGLPKGAVNLA